MLTTSANAVKHVPVNTKACRCCKGSGTELDHVVVGAEMLKLRMSKGLSQATVAKRMRCTGAYVCDLEKGRRNWNEVLIFRFKKACS